MANFEQVGPRWSIGNGPAVMAATEDLKPPPEFREAARPRQIDPDLLALDPTSDVLFHTLPALSTGVYRCPASEVVAHVGAQINRQASGFFTLAETAHILADANPGCVARDLINRMMVAEVIGPNGEVRRLPREPESKFPVAPGATAWSSLWVVTPVDIDAWLLNGGMPYRFPAAPRAIGISHDETPEAGNTSPWFHAGIAGRHIEGETAFGSHLFSVADLMQWAAKSGLHLKVPAIDGRDFVQVEYLLSELERQSTSEISSADAAALEALAPPDPNEPFSDQPAFAHWKHGAKAHFRWRRLFGKAVDARELQLLDFASKLPIERFCAQSVPAVVVAAKPGMSQAAKKVAREDKRLAECEADGLVFDKTSLLRLPDGIGASAKKLKIERQSLAKDLQTALRRRFAVQKDGNT